MILPKPFLRSLPLDRRAPVPGSIDRPPVTLLSPRLAAMIGLALGLSVAVTGCGSPTRAATGIVLGLETEGSAVTGFTLRTDAGEVIQFRIGTLELDDGAFAAAHLAVHAATLQPVAVEYLVENGVAVAHRLVDAPGASASP